MKSIWKYSVWNVFTYFCFMSLLLMQSETENLWITKLATMKTIGFRKHPRKNTWKHKIFTRKKFGPKKYPREKSFGLTKFPREKTLNPRNNRKSTNVLESRDPWWYAISKIYHTLLWVKYLFYKPRICWFNPDY